MADQRPVTDFPDLEEAPEILDDDLVLMYDAALTKAQKMPWSTLKAEIGAKATLTTATGTQTVGEAVDGRVIYFDTIAQRDALSSYKTDQQVVVDGATFKWDGATWVNLSGFITPEMYGATDSDTDDNTTALKNSATAAAKITWKLRRPQYTFTEEIDVPDGTRIESVPGKTILRSTISANADAPNIAAVYFHGDESLTAIPDLFTDVDQNDRVLDFVSAHGLSVGDPVVIYNPTDSSWSGWRTTYREGEIAYVQEVIDSDSIRLDRSLFSGYTAANVDLYTLSFASYSFSGEVEVIHEGSATDLYCVSFFRVHRTDITPLKTNGPACFGGVQFKQSLHFSGQNQRHVQYGDNGAAVAYGVVFIGCQSMYLEGYFSGEQHGSATGSSGTVGDVVNRDIHLKGEFNADFTSASADWHGNTELCSYEGIFYGFLFARGNRNKASGTLYTDSRGLGVLFDELKGYDMDISGLKIFGTADPVANAGGRAVIDMGASNTGDEFTTEGGTINLSGTEVTAPLAERVIQLTRRVSTTPNARVNIEGFVCHDSTSNIVSININALSGAGNWEYVRTEGFSFPAGHNFTVANADKIYACFSGTETLTTDTGTNIVSTTVNFPFDFASGDIPNIYYSHDQARVGGKWPAPGAYIRTNSDFGLALLSVDTSNFGANTAVEVDWKAEIKFPVNR